jgi:hypothetical protein
MEAYVSDWHEGTNSFLEKQIPYRVYAANLKATSSLRNGFPKEMHATKQQKSINSSREKSIP